MKITCAQCHAVYSIDDALAGGRNIKAQCPACGNIQLVEGEAPGPPPLPQSPPPLPPLPAGGEPAGATPALDPQVAPALESAPARCERCGSILGPQDEGALCGRCRQQPWAAPGADDRVWRVKKQDGIVLGPLTAEEVREKFRRGEIGATDTVSRGEASYRLISSFPEFAEFFRRPGERLEMTFRHPPRRRWRGALVALLSLLVLAGAVVLVWWISHRQPAVPQHSVIDDIREEFSREVGTPTGSAATLLQKARELMLRDERLSYLRADNLLKKAFLLEPYNQQVGAAWVQNRALLDSFISDASGRKLAFDLVDLLLSEHPDDPGLLRARGHLLLTVGRVAEARVLAEQLAAKDPADQASQLLLAMTYLESSTELALEKLNQVSAAAPELNLAERLKGEAFLRLGRFRRAESLLQARLRKDPTQLDTVASLGRLYLEVGEYEQARERFETILAADAGNLEAALLLSRIYGQIENKPAAALPWLKKLLEAESELTPADRAQLLAEKAQIDRLAGDLKGSRAAAEEALRLDHTCTPARFALAIVDQLENQVKPAMGGWLSLQAHLTDSPRSKAWLAECWNSVPNMSKAQEEFRQAADQAGQDVELMLEVASFFASVDDFPQAYLWLKSAVSADPFHHRRHFRLSATYDSDVLLQAAEKRMQEAAARSPEDPLMLSLQGMVLLQRGKHAAARSSLKRALEQDPECFPANLAMGLVEWKEGNNSRVLSFWKEAHRLEPSLPATACLYGLALSKTGQPAQAEKIFTSVLYRQPGYQMARLGQAENWLAMKKKKKALETLVTLHQADRENIYLKSLIFQLGR